MPSKKITDLQEILPDLKHVSSICSDDKPANHRSIDGGEKPKCQRCAVLKALADPDYKIDVVAFVNYDITFK